MKIFFHSPLADESAITYYRFLKEENHELTSVFNEEYKPEDLKKTEFREKARLFLKNEEKNIKRSDVVVLITNKQSVGSGYIIGIATRLSKPIILIFHDRDRLPFFYECVEYNKLLLVEVDSENYKYKISRALKDAQKIIDKRFTLLLPPEVVELLDNHYKKTGQTRSEYIRDLIRANYKSMRPESD